MPAGQYPELTDRLIGGLWCFGYKVDLIQGDPVQMSYPLQKTPTRKENPFLIYNDLTIGRRPPVTQRQPGQTRIARTASVKTVPSKKTAVQKRLKLGTVISSLKMAAMALLLLAGALIFLPFPGKEQLMAAFAPKIPAKQTVLNTVLTPIRYNYISSHFGPRWGRMHQGIDLVAVPGTPIHALSGGRVIHSGWEAGYGRSLVIDHGNGMQTRYAHCSRLLAKEGSKVKQGELIAHVGSTGHSTGPHLHLEVIVKGERKNPAWYYRFGPNALIAQGPKVQKPQKPKVASPLDVPMQGLLAWIRPVLPAGFQ